MIKSTVTLQITIDEETLRKNYPNFDTNWNTVEEFVEHLSNGFETPIIDVDGKTPRNFLKEYGYEVAIMDKKEGPWEK